MTPNLYLKERRNAIGATDIEIANLAGLSIHEYGDLEQHVDEFVTAISLSTAKKLCHLLSLDLLSVLGISDAGDAPTERILRNDLIRQAREKKSLSIHEAADGIGFFDEVIVNAEADPEFLETLPIEVVLELGKLLSVSPKVMLGI